MNQLIEINGTQTMGTSEIAKMIGKVHASIMRSCLILSEKGLLEGGKPVVHPYKTKDGQEYTEFRLNKRDSILLVAQNSPEFTAVLVDRWQELEKELANNEVQKKLPKNYKEALLCLVEAEEEKEQMQLQIEAQQPFVEATERLLMAKSTISIGDMAKLLCKEGFKTGQNRLFSTLREKRILMSDNRPYQRYIENGYFEVKQNVIETSKGSIVSFQTRVTGKGQVAILKMVKDEVK